MTGPAPIEGAMYALFELIRIMLNAMDRMIINNNVTWLDWVIAMGLALIVSGAVFTRYINGEKAAASHAERVRRKARG